MKKLITILLLCVFFISCKKQVVKKDRYEVKQKVYSKQGKDSVETNVFLFEEDGWLGVSIYNSKDLLDQIKEKEVEAENFIVLYKAVKVVKNSDDYDIR